MLERGALLNGEISHLIVVVECEEPELPSLFPPIVDAVKSARKGGGISSSDVVLPRASPTRGLQLPCRVGRTLVNPHLNRRCVLTVADPPFVGPRKRHIKTRIRWSARRIPGRGCRCNTSTHRVPHVRRFHRHLPRIGRLVMLPARSRMRVLL